VSLLDIVPTLFALQHLGASEDWDGRPLPGVTDAPAREEVFSIYGAGGPPFTVADWAKLPVTRGNNALMASLKPREAEGERSMVRTCRHKFVHDLARPDRDELYHLETDPHEIHNLAGLEDHAALETELRDKLIAFRRRPGAVLSARSAA
jgi:arylsulfatase A-like enzyme